MARAIGQKPAGPANQRAARIRSRRETLISYVFLLPYLVLLAMFGVLPVFYAFGLSFFDTIGGVFWWFTNYQTAFADFRLGASVVNILTYVAIWVAGTVVGVVALSLMLDTLRRGTATTLRTIFFLPGAITSSAIVVLWLFMLDPLVSPFQPLFHLLGWSSRQNVVTSIGFAGIFALMGYFANSGGWIVVFGGALASIPPELSEAARIDGANRWQMAVQIKLPMIWRSVVLMAILCFAAGIQIFVEPQLMSLAGLQYSRTDWSVNQLAFQYAFSMGDFGTSAALSTMMLTASIAIALVIIFATKFYKLD
jgi:multiple sugar transport system permease protein